MHTLSSASRTCIASASAVECTATVAIPSSLQARSTRKAISPRLAMRILSNMLCLGSGDWGVGGGKWKNSVLPNRYSPLPAPYSLFHNHQRFAELDRLAVLDQDLRHRAGARRRDMVH